MIIFVDTREKPRAIKKIELEFFRQGIEICSTKLWIGDYQNPQKPLIFIDRKQNIAEIASNATVDHKRFKRELERLDKVGGKMYILIEQDKIDGKPIKELSDIILWRPKFGQIVGERVFRVLASWKNKHNIEYVFCSKKDTGKKIIELLEVRDGS